MVLIPWLDRATLTFDIDGHPLSFTPNDTSFPIAKWAHENEVRQWAIFFADDLTEQMPDGDAVSRWLRVFLDELTGRMTRHWLGHVTRTTSAAATTQSVAVLVLLEHRLTQAMGEEFGFRRLLASTGKLSPPELVVLKPPMKPQSDTGFPLRTSNGSLMRVIGLHMEDVFAGYIEGGPRGVEVAGLLHGEARTLFGVPIVHCDSSDELRGLDRRQVVQRLPRVCCSARVVIDRDAGSESPFPTPVTVTWLIDALAGSSLEQILRYGLEDLVVGERGPPVAMLGSVTGRMPSAFADQTFTTLDGFVVRVTAMWIMPGPAPSAALSLIHPSVSAGHHLFVHHAGEKGTLPQETLLRHGDASLRLALVASPIARPDGEASVGAVNVDGPAPWTASHLTVLAIIQPGAEPLQNSIAAVVSALRWTEVAHNVDDTP